MKILHRGRCGDREDSEALRPMEGTVAAPAAERDSAAQGRRACARLWVL
jgi:hypothetical protein